MADVSRRSLLDSPWYWAYVFLAAALAALFLMGPRYAQRQAQIERNYQARQRAAQYRAGEAPRTPLSDEERTAIPLWPLFLVLSALLAVTWYAVWRRGLTPRTADNAAAQSPSSLQGSRHESA